MLEKLFDNIKNYSTRSFQWERIMISEIFQTNAIIIQLSIYQNNLIQTMNEDQTLPKSPKKIQKANSQQQTPKKSDQGQKVQGRKIPQTLIGQYDLITLKEQKKKRFNFKKSQSKQQPTQNADLEKLKPLFGQCSCGQDLKQQFTSTVFQLTSTLFVLSKICSFRVRSINKIKIIGEYEGQGQNQQIKSKYLKITWKQEQNQQDYNIFVKHKIPQQAYLLFSSIVTRKLLLQDFVLPDLCFDQKKDFVQGVKKIEGDIYKVSTFMRKWEKRSAKIQDKLSILKDGKVSQQIKSLKQVWTRFTMHNGYFVVKMFEGIEKIQLGIPLVDYSNIKSSRNWLFLLSKMIR